MLQLERTTATNPDFISLIAALDAELKVRDGEQHAFFAQFNTVEAIEHVVVAYKNRLPVGCGALKKYAATTMEIKRVYVVPQYRGQGVASTLLKALEQWTREVSCHTCILETGIQQPEALALYKKQGYTIIPNYGPYVDVAESVCFEKHLSPEPLSF